MGPLLPIKDQRNHPTTPITSSLSQTLYPTTEPNIWKFIKSFLPSPPSSREKTEEEILIAVLCRDTILDVATLQEFLEGTLENRTRKKIELAVKKRLIQFTLDVAKILNPEPETPTLPSYQTLYTVSPPEHHRVHFQEPLPVYSRHTYSG